MGTWCKRMYAYVYVNHMFIKGNCMPHIVISKCMDQIMKCL